ncbi:hypothetical protein Tco_0472635 [Tanacetum coccineum]
MMKRIETDVFHFETPICKAFKEFNHLLQIDVDVLIRDLLGFKTYEDYKIHGSMNGIIKCHGLRKNHGLEDSNLKEETLKEKAILEGSWGHENRKGKNFCSWLKESFGNYHELDYELILKLEEYWWGKKEEEDLSKDAWSTYLPSDDNDAIQANQERKDERVVRRFGVTHSQEIHDDDAIQATQELFDDHKPIGDDDDIGDLDDYLIPHDEPYYVDEEEEDFKERRSKLLGIPYEKPPTFKSKKFEVIKYSFEPVEEYVSHVYQDIFRKKDEGWFVTKTT